MNVTFNREISLVATVTPADQLSSGSFDLSVVNRVAPTANLALTGRVVFFDATADAITTLNLQYWTLSEILGSAGNDASRYTYGFTGFDADGVSVGAASKMRELAVQSYPLADFVNYATNYNVFYNAVAMYFLSSSGTILGQQMLYPGDHLTFGSQGDPTALNGGATLANAKYLYVASLGPIHPYYSPSLDVMNLRKN